MKEKDLVAFQNAHTRILTRGDRLLIQRLVCDDVWEGDDGYRTVAFVVPSRSKKWYMTEFSGAEDLFQLLVDVGGELYGEMP